VEKSEGLRRSHAPQVENLLRYAATHAGPAYPDLIEPTAEGIAQRVSKSPDGGWGKITDFAGTEIA
jgi:hypothetical protein